MFNTIMWRMKGHKKKFVLRIYPYAVTRTFRIQKNNPSFLQFWDFSATLFSRHDRSLSCTSDTF